MCPGGYTLVSPCQSPLLFFTWSCREGTLHTTLFPPSLGSNLPLSLGEKWEAEGGARDLIYPICFLFLAASPSHTFYPAATVDFNSPTVTLSEPATATSLTDISASQPAPALLSFWFQLCSFFSKLLGSNNSSPSLCPLHSPTLHPEGGSYLFAVIISMCPPYHFLPYQSFNLFNQFSIIISLC